MPSTITDAKWISLDLLAQRFQANLTALAGRDPAAAQQLAALTPERKYFIQAIGDQVSLGTEIDGEISTIPPVLSPASAAATVDKMFPDKNYKISLVAGEDIGWLWNRLYALPCSAPTMPGFRPPLFFLMHDLERLRVIFHIQDWRTLLADPRVRLFLGPDCIPQFRRSLLEDAACPWPVLWVTVTPDIWPAGVAIESIISESRAVLDAELTALKQKMSARAAASTPATAAAKFASDRALKVLGITSRYTSFIQHSMRDWLDGFARLGHTVQLEIEGADHELANTLMTARTFDQFDPDLIVSIDHYRKSLAGVGEDVPVVMWIQDALPALFNKDAGAAQGPLDFSMSVDPLKMVHEFGYPPDRIMSAVIGVNDKRFEIPAVHGSGPSGYACDVSFVSHASAPAEELLQNYLAANNSDFAIRFWNHLFESLKQIYDDGKMVTNPIILRQMMDQSIRDTQVTIRPDQIATVEFILSNQLNNALFRHQSLQWLADGGVDLHLYGNGWEKHPTLARYARGPADNKTGLAAIFRSSKINLQISPHGAAHQRVMEGLTAGGFFMLRWCAGDTIERHFKTIREFCKERNIETDAQLQALATPEIDLQMRQAAEILQENPFAGRWPFVETLRSAEENGYVRSAAGIWGEDYDAVAWNSAGELMGKVSHFLVDETDRQRRANSMRRTVLQRFTYRQTAGQVVDFVRRRLCGQAENE